MLTKMDFSVQPNSVLLCISPNSILMEHHCRQPYHCRLNFMLNKPSNYQYQTTAKRIAVLKFLNDVKIMFMKVFYKVKGFLMWRSHNMLVNGQVKWPNFF